MKKICIALLTLGLIQTGFSRDMKASTPVSAISADDLDNTGSSDVTKLAETVPPVVGQNNQGPYISLRGGAVVPGDSDVKYSGSGGSGNATLSYKSGYILEGAFGYSFGDAVMSCAGFPSRLEIALGYAMFDWDTWTEAGIAYDESRNSTSFLNVMLNGYWDFENQSRFTPFALAGLGFTRAAFDHNNNSYTDTVFAGQLGIGVSWALSSMFSIDATYRYFLSQDIEFTDAIDTTKIENQQHQFLLGGNLRF